MIILFIKSQLALFDAPVQVSAHVRKDGTVVAPHTRIQKVALKPVQHSLFAPPAPPPGPAPAPKKRLAKVDTFIARHGGPQGLAKLLEALTDAQRARILEEMARLDGKTVEEVQAMLGQAEKPAPAAEAEAAPDLFNQPDPPAEAAAPTGAERLLLVACGGKKQDGPRPASELYTGALGAVLAKWIPGGAERPDVHIISAKHGLVHGDTVIEPYDQRMTPARAQELATQGLDLAAFKGKKFKDVFVAGGADYRQVADAYIKQLQDAGVIAPGATVNSTSGGIGEIRGQLGTYLRSLGGAPAVDKKAQVVDQKRPEPDQNPPVVDQKPPVVNDKPGSGSPVSDKPEPNGASFGELYHGTALPFDAFSAANMGKLGGGENHQGKGVYLTTDQHGFAKFFAGAAVIKVTNKRLATGQMTEKEADALEAKGGTVLTTRLAKDARILDLREGKHPELLQLATIGRKDRDAGEKLRGSVLALGYDGVAFVEPTDIQGWETQPDAATFVVYDPSKVAIDKQASPHDRTAPFGVAPGTSKKKRREINAAAIASMETDAPDLALLRQYSGNGGCGDSLNEYYTDPAVATAMWEALRTLGFNSGTALEPSCATGVFLHTAPEGVRVTGVELEPVSAKAALALHGDRHEIVTSSLERFATSDDRQFDVVIGNPPYGPRGFLAKDDKVGISTCEQYFTDTALDKCKPGGLVALVVPTGIMDSKNGRLFRESMLTKGEFLGAHRMPNTAFEHSHTEVTTDVIYLRKRPDDVAGALATVDQGTLKTLGIWDDDFLSGSYFTGRGAANVLGTMGEGWRAKAGMGQDITVEGSMQGVPAAIAAFQPDAESARAGELSVPEILSAVGDDPVAQSRVLSGAARRPYSNQPRVGDTKTVDGITYVLQGDPPRWRRTDEFMATDAIAEATELANKIDELINGRSARLERPALQARIEAYVAKHGIPVDNAALMTAARVDKRLFRLVGAVNRKGELSDVVAGRAPRATGGSLDALAQTMAIEREDGLFTSAALAERLGKPLEEVEDQLAADPRYAFAGAGQWTTMESYLTGELWPKLDTARAGGPPELADKLRMQAERLEKVIDAKSLDDVEIQMNSGFVPSAVLAAFFNWQQYDSPEANEWTKKRDPVEIKFDGGVFVITGGNQYGDIKLLDKLLNRTGVKKDDKDHLDALNGAFKEWLCASTHRDAVEEAYNRTFRGFVAREFSNEPIDVPGLTTDHDVRDWRWSSLRRSLATGKGIVADDVGLGKTLGGLLLARMAKVQGSAKRPVTVVPKSVLANWYAESQVWFPGCRVLTIGANFAYDKNGELTGKDDSAAERKRKYHDLTQNDYDFVFISEPAFEEVDLNPVTKEKYYSSDFWVQRGEKLGNAGDKRRKAIRENYEQHLAKREFQDRTDALYFDDLGIDMLIADEMHHQKNLYAARARFGEQPKFLGGQGLSNRALDFNLKTRLVREQNGGKNVHGLTATPTKNSPLEIYSMLSHIAPEAFERIKIRNSEEFLDRFCEFTSDKVLSTSGDIEDAQVVSGFKNLDELREIMSRYIDRRTAEQVGLVLPERQDRMHLVEMTAAQKEVYTGLREQLLDSGKKDATGDAHVFSIMDKMNKAALDLELLDPAQHAGAKSLKYAELAKHAVEGVKDGGQIVFSEYVDSHEKIVSALVDAGFKRSEIGIINAKVAGSAVKRQNIADAFNAGKLKVVVGNCTMAEGLNLQKGTSDIHHMDLPWEPATMQQRNGRGLRQGNMSEAVRIHSYLSKGSFDGYRYQAIAAKKDWQDLLWNGGDRVENLAREGNISLDDMRIMLAADPDKAREEFEKDKTAAMQRFEAGERVEANATFVRFQEMSRSYRALKNKGTASGERLRSRLEATKTSLFNNKYFPAKSALDRDGDVLIEPNSGAVLTAGVGIDAGKDGKMVITGVNSRLGTVTMRRYADTTGAKSVTVPMAELSRDAAPFKHDQAAEDAEVKAKFEEEAAANLNSLSTWEAVKRMPSSVLEANHDLIQRQIKAHTKAYSGFRDLPHDKVAMVDKATGAIKVVESFQHNGMHDTHDYLLPTDAAKERAVQAWVDARRESRLSVEYVERHKGPGSRSGVSDRVAKRNYKDAKYNAKDVNPLRSLLRDLSPATESYQAQSALEKVARARLDAEQLQRIRRAGSVADVLEHLAPLAKVGGSGDDSHRAAYPKDALALAWARVRHLGQLDTKIDERGRHATYAYAGGSGKTAHSALLRMARASGHGDLADALATTAERHGLSKDDRHTLAALTHFNASKPGMEVAKKVAGRLGVLDTPVSELRDLGLGGQFAAPGQSYGYGSAWGEQARGRRKLGELMDEHLAALTAKETAKETA